MRTPAAPATPLVKRVLTRPDGTTASPFELVDWSVRAVQVMDPNGSIAFACEDVEAPLSWSNAAAAVVARRYFARPPGGPSERSVRALIERVVGAIADWALATGHVSGSEEHDALRAKLTALVLTQRATFATPVWLSAGLAERPLTSACFILDAEDSIPALLEWNTREGLIFQQGGGAGINLSRIRSSREPVSRGGLASGPVSFMRATDAWAATIRAGGRARRGAKMVMLDAWHPDILEFIDVKALRRRPRPRPPRRRISTRRGARVACLPARKPFSPGDRRVHAARDRRRRVDATRGENRGGPPNAPGTQIASRLR